MGYALAEAALRRGARVLLVSGPTDIMPPGAAELTRVETADEMRAGGSEVAAASHHRHQDRGRFRLPPQGRRAVRSSSAPARLSLELEPTADILAELATRKTNQLIIGFAAETQDVLENARKKLAKKSLDAIVVNDVSQRRRRLRLRPQRRHILTHDEVVEVPETTKWEVAQRVLDQVVKLRKRNPVPVKA